MKRSTFGDLGALLALPLVLACGSTPPAVTTGSCATSPGAYCSAAPAGTCTWPGPAPSATECPHTFRSTSCGPYDAVLVQGVDTSTVRYYEHGTGALVAVIHHSVVLPQATCEAGPSEGFAEPTCGAGTFVSTCPDGGT
jgi:hypothetical protein